MSGNPSYSATVEPSGVDESFARSDESRGEFAARLASAAQRITLLQMLS